MILNFPHFGIHVADIDVATRFYVDGMGFERLESGDTDAIGPLLRLPGAVVRTQFVGYGPQKIELWTIGNRTPEGNGNPGPANRLGRPHLCFIVADIDAATARIAEHGGQVIDESRLDLGYGELMFCADPDGTRIEIIQMKAQWPGYDALAPDQIA